MKTKITGLLLTLILLIFGLPSCNIPRELHNPDYITVNVDAYTNVKISKLISGQNIVVPWPGNQVKISIVKSDGNHVDGFKTTDGGGITDSVIGTFKLYREQYIRVFVSFVIDGAIPDVLGGGVYDPVIHILNNPWQELTWAEVNAVKDIGETYNWYTTVHVLADVA